MFKKVIWSIALLGWVVASPPVRAQTSGNSVRIYTDPGGVYFQVDGQNFLNEVDFLWPVNSKHVVTSYDQSPTQSGTVTQYQGWVTNLSSTISKSEPITADPNLRWIKLVFTTSYLLTIDLVDCPASETCTFPGTVEIVGQGTFSRRTQLYIAALSSVEARAFPNSGFIFTGWTNGYGTAFDIHFVMTGPLQLSPSFSNAAAVGLKVNVITDPPQLQVLLDRTPYTPPVSLDWGWGTVHTLGANPVQVALGTTYVFDSWSDGGAINHDIQVPSQSAALTFTARFVPATFATFATSPPGLSLSVDGRMNWPNYIFAWAQGTTHTISAPATETDAQGRQYRFVSWSNGKPANFDYVTGPAPGGSTVTALYQAASKATISSVPLGLTLQVDGSDCTTPCTLTKDVGMTIGVSAPLMLNVTDQSRLVFQGWGDSSASSRVIQMAPDPKTYTATYNVQNRLSLSATPPEGAAFVVTPSSTDAFYDAGSLVSVTSKLALGFSISRWSGDISATGSSVGITLNSPISATLLLNRVPAIAPLGIRNAAAGASADSFAPGSLISIFGANLAADLLAGPTNPLPQILDNVTVRADDAFLPLAFVSPGQINAQLPAALSQGLHQIVVHWEGKPETTVQISITRNAPGLFNTGQQDQPIGLFLRTDGSAVTEDHPAAPNEIVSVLGTGLGPYAQPPPDGFLLDESSGYTLVDPVVVIVADNSGLDPLYAGRSSVAVGVDAVRFQVPAGLDSPLVPVRIRINGKESNTVFLPISQ